MLAAFLDHASRTPFAWGTFDCSLWLADWLVARGYPDPATHLRGRYSTALGCKRLLKRHGGVVNVVASCVDPLGLVRTETPAAGAIGVVRAITRRGEDLVGAICTGPRWAMLAAGGGLISAPGQPLVAWEV